jgi:hypothetical protein
LSLVVYCVDIMEGHRAEALEEAFQELLRFTARCNSPLLAGPQQPASGPPGAVASEEEKPHDPMALSTLSGDEQGIILGQLRNTLEPWLIVYFSSASKELRALLAPAAQQQLRTDYEEATALCVKMGMQSCKELCEARMVQLVNKGLSATDLATLAKLGPVLPALVRLTLIGGSAGPDGVQRLAEGLVAGALPAVTYLSIGGMHVGDAGASALAAALDRGALPRLMNLQLSSAAIGDAALAALAPALRRRPALTYLRLGCNPLGDEGLAALVAPPPPAASTPPRPAGGLTKLKKVDFSFTRVTDAGCATLVAALDSGALPALEELEELELDIPHARAAAKDALRAALARSREARSLGYQAHHRCVTSLRRKDTIIQRVIQDDPNKAVELYLQEVDDCGGGTPIWAGEISPYLHFMGSEEIRALFPGVPQPGEQVAHAGGRAVGGKGDCGGNGDSNRRRRRRPPPRG